MNKIFATLALALACFGFSATTFAMADESDVVIAEETTDMVQELIYNAPVLECETWQVPGWLNEFGDPTGCVDNAPCPEVREGLSCPADIPVVETVVPPVTPSEAPVTPSTPVEVLMEAPVEAPLTAPVTATETVTPVVDTVPMLAETGVEVWVGLLVGGFLVAIGIAVVVIRSQK